MMTVCILLKKCEGLNLSKWLSIYWTPWDRLQSGDPGTFTLLLQSVFLARHTQVCDFLTHGLQCPSCHTSLLLLSSFSISFAPPVVVPVAQGQDSERGWQEAAGQAEGACSCCREAELHSATAGCGWEWLGGARTESWQLLYFYPQTLIITASHLDLAARHFFFFSVGIHDLHCHLLDSCGTTRQSRMKPVE